MQEVLRPGERLSTYSKETANRAAGALPHKHTSLFLYRDYLRVISRKYQGSQVKYLKHATRHNFLTYRYLEDKERMQMVGEGTRFLGLLACAEELHDAGLKNSYLKDKMSYADERDVKVDPKRYVVAPYVFSYDVWKNYGLDEYGQSTAWIRFYNSIKKVNNEYGKAAEETQDAARKWLIERLEKYEEVTQKENDAIFESMSEEERLELLGKIRTVFDHMDVKKTGFLDFKALEPLFDKTTQDHISPKAYLYLCDQVGADYEEGLDFEAFRKLYITLGMFDVEEHVELCQTPIDSWIEKVDVDPESLKAAAMAQLFMETGETYFDHVEPLKVEDIPPGVQIRPKNREECVKPRYRNGRNYNITTHPLPHNAHELSCINRVAALYYPRYEYEERLMERIKAEGEFPTIDPEDTKEDLNNELLQNSLGPAEHLKSDDPEQPDVMFRGAGAVSGEVFGVRCEFGPLNKYVPFKEVVLPDDPQFLEEMPAGSLRGKIPLVQRGGGKFVEKTKRAERAGAAAVLLWNHLSEAEIMSIAGEDPTIKIPTIFINDPEIGHSLTELIEKGGKPTASFSNKTGWIDAKDLCRRALLVRQLNRLEEMYLDEYLDDHRVEIPADKDAKVKAVEEHIFQSFEREVGKIFQDRFLDARVNNYDEISKADWEAKGSQTLPFDEHKQELDIMEATPI